MLKAGTAYFLLVFGVGFLLGFIRVLWIIPLVGERTAELIEMPLMLLTTILAARWVAQRFSLPPSTGARLGVGGVALGFLLATEFTVVLRLRGITIPEYIAARDPVSGAVYVVMLGVFALMPLLAVRRSAR